MKRSILLTLGLAVGAFLLLFSVIQSIIQIRMVVTARYDLAAGTRLTEDLLELRELPASAVPEGAYDSFEQAVGRVLTTARVAGDPITAYVAGESEAAAGLPAQLAPNHVAISVRVDQATGLAGVLRPGQTVSVIAIVDPARIAQHSLQSVSGPLLEQPSPGGTPLPPTPTPPPPVSPAARVVISGLKVLVVPQTFRYEEIPPGSAGQDPFAPARTTASMQQGSVVLLQAPLAPVQVAPGLFLSPAELLALLNQTATLHLALEPAGGVSVRVQAAQPADLARLYEAISGLELLP